MKNKNRKKVLDDLYAAMAVIVQAQDLEMSATIMSDAAESYGKKLVDSILYELMSSDFDGHFNEFQRGHVSEDIIRIKAMLALMRPLPLSWFANQH